MRTFRTMLRPYFAVAIKEMEMLFIFLAASTVVVLVYALLSWLVIPRLQQTRWSTRMGLHGLEAEAVILNMELTGVYVGNEPQVKMHVMVQPGREGQFISEMMDVFSLIELSYLRKGAVLKVKYIPGDTKKVQMVRNRR